jgi:hypothetical protein
MPGETGLFLFMLRILFNDSILVPGVLDAGELLSSENLFPFLSGTSITKSKFFLRSDPVS